MARNRAVLTYLTLVLMLLAASTAQAAAVITMQVEILAGFSIACEEDNLAFGTLSPEQTVQKELELTVWSNVPWDLYVDYTGTGDLPGLLEVQDERGVWLSLGDNSRMVLFDQPETGRDGSALTIPVRFTSSYSDAPGTYEFQIEFTVVPSL
ncbi:MAG: hypothetical protein GX199_06250 [Firmicutes bacterium]|nr:hypothetical protein [Bacillota bacterium]